MPAKPDHHPFTLPLAVFERYMLCDDRPAYPMTFVWRLELDGEADRETLDAAFAEALQRHPLLTARLRGRGNRAHWAAGDFPRPVPDWHCGDAAPPVPLGERINLRNQAGVRCRVDVHRGSTLLTCLFHHAVCDGIGAIQFIGDLLACYGHSNSAADQGPRLLPLSDALLARREWFAVRTPHPVPARTASMGLLREAWKLIMRRPLGLRAVPDTGPAESPAMPLEQLQRETYDRLRACAAGSGVTTNDLLLRDMFLTLNQWLALHDRPRKGWLRITMPTSLRGRGDALLPAANKLGYAFITHHTRECADPAELLADIARETEAIRTWGMGALFVSGMRLAGRLPGLLWTGARASRRFSTLVLTNLGDPTRRMRARFPRAGGMIRAGDLTVRAIYGVPPIRPGTHAALGVFSYAGRLSIALYADPRLFSRDQGQKFLALYRARLEHTAAEY